jgi:A/G-specific adenine glycosylase
MLYEVAGSPELPFVLARRLCDWYLVHARDLPWRRAPTPYAVLLSEIMLQQTRVDTVIPYFERFLRRWPTIADLAAADEEEVLKEWAGLGYYSRARNLHKAARAAAAHLPTTADGLRELPGIGPYTAGAIASIAFHQPEPAVDGNVERVLTRLRAIEEDPKSKVGRDRIHREASSLYRPGAMAGEIGVDPGTLTQALMELGATVCTPRKPACSRCPWTAHCAAREADPESYPRKTAKAPPVPVRGVCAIWRVGKGVWMGRRPPGLLAGMWEPLLAEFTDGDPATVLAESLFAATGVRPTVGRKLGTVVHVFTHRRLFADVFEVFSDATPTATARYEALSLVDPARPAVPLSTLAVKLCRAAGIDAASRAS